MTHRRFVCSLLVTMLAVAGLVVASGGAAQAASATFNAPVYAGDFPDATIVLVNGTYWAYSTGSAGRNLQAMSSTDLHSWQGPTDPLPVLPAWASSGRTWAPGVVQHGTTMVMYYTVHDVALKQQCISVATSPNPGGRVHRQLERPVDLPDGERRVYRPEPLLRSDQRTELLALEE